ncbi:DUF3515 domain-containing protein [Actinocrispum sp. NPDC049592]|uniref:DUF3515 domain-containing protein n=1 Tax=Actinocrispum sp. NPDC049592 TaxID=3154835 RepID=UPI0034367ACD
MNRTRVVIAASLSVVLIAGVIVFGIVVRSQQPPAKPVLVPVPAPQATSADCTALLGKLPESLQSGSTVLSKAALAAPAPPASVAWTDNQSEPVVLRCGLDKPAELGPTTQTRAIDGVQWLPIDGADATTWFTVDRTVFVALTVPTAAGTGPLQDISRAVGQFLPKKT